jgi:hypothetical protein
LIIYKDPISEALGIRNIYELVPDFDPSEGQEELMLYINGPGELNSFYGQKHTKETKDLLSKLSKGKYNSMHGRSAIAEQRLRWYNNGSKNIYVTECTEPEGFVRGRIGLKRKPHSKEHREKISKAIKGKPANNRLIVKSPSGKEYPSIKSAAEACELSVSAFRYRKVDKGEWIIIR